MKQKLNMIRAKYLEGLSAVETARTLGISRAIVERQFERFGPRLKGHDSWVQETLASGDKKLIKDLQEYFPLRLGCPIPMSPEWFENLHKA